jgi:hypothetical protein
VVRVEHSTHRLIDEKSNKEEEEEYEFDKRCFTDEYLRRFLSNRERVRERYQESMFAVKSQNKGEVKLKEVGKVLQKVEKVFIDEDQG